MKHFIFFLSMLIANAAFSQTCSICPAGTTTTLQSTYPVTSAHLWTCTNGFSSSLVSPTFAPSADVTCNLLVTDASGCTATGQVTVDVCDCNCSQACTVSDYDANLDKVFFHDVGNTCSNITSQTRQYKNISSGAYVNIPGSNEISGCAIKEYLDAAASVSISGSSFSLNVTGLNNKCSCVYDMEVYYMFNQGSNASYYPSCATSSQSHLITPAAFSNQGNICDVYVGLWTNWGYILNQYRFNYNGSGLNVNNVTVSTVIERTIYKTIYSKRTISYSNCPQTVCESIMTIPKPACSNAVSFITPSNCVGCTGSTCLVSNSFNPNSTISSQQWYYNGSAISPSGTGFSLCMNGRPFGEYCVNTVFSDGCTASACRIVQPACNLTVNITEASNILTATLTGCNGTPQYTWTRWNGSSWITVGTNSSSYNTGGTSGEYRCTVYCNGTPSCTSIGYYTKINNCIVGVSLADNTTFITATVSGCGGSNINYQWSRWNGTSWISVQVVNTVSTTNNYTPSQNGQYRVFVTCNNCTAEAQISFTVPNPCSGFSVSMTGPTGSLCNGTDQTWGRTITGGSAPFTNEWKRNISSVGTGTTYTYNMTGGSHTIQVIVTDNNGCTAASSRSVTGVTCCGLSVSLSADQTVCINEDALFNATPAGGTPPITYSWSSSSPTIGAGTGNPKIFNFGTIGTRTIQVLATDVNNCSSTDVATMTVTACTDCVCDPELTLSSCQLTGTFSGGGCTNYQYQLQYSATGSGWTVLTTGTVGGSINHTPTSNGFYRIVIFANDCSSQESDIISVGCVIDCNCTAGTLVKTDCTLSWNNPCSGAGFIANLRRYNGASWVYVSNSSPFIPLLSGDYRVVYSKGGCDPVISNSVTVTVPDCEDSFLYYSEEHQEDLYCAAYYWSRETATSPSVNNTVRTNTNTCSVSVLGPYDWIVDYDNGNNVTGTNYSSFTYAYPANGTYKMSYDLTIEGVTCENEFYVYPSGSFPVPKIRLNPECAELVEPVYFSIDGCRAKFWFNFILEGLNVSAITYNSHQFKINNVVYPITRTVVDPVPFPLWEFRVPILNPLIIDLDSLLPGPVPVELTVTINTNQTLKLKGYVWLCEICVIP